MSKKAEKPQEIFDFHFVIKGSPADKFASEAQDLGRTYTEHFRRVLNERYENN